MQYQQLRPIDLKITKSIVAIAPSMLRGVLLSALGISLIACTKVKFDDVPSQEKTAPSLTVESFEGPVEAPVAVSQPAPAPTPPAPAVKPPEKDSIVLKCPIITTTVNGNGCSTGAVIMGGGGNTTTGSRNVQASSSCTQSYQNGVKETTTTATTESDDPNAQAYSYAVMIEDGKVTSLSEAGTNLKEGSSLRADYQDWIQGLTQSERSRVDLKNCVQISVPSNADFNATKDYFLFSEVNLGKITATKGARVRVIRSQVGELSITGSASGCADNQSKIQAISGSVSRCR